jgi:four helix bundle protein
MKDFRDLKIWDRSHRFTLAVYRLTRQFPKEETYGLTSQMRRSASSIATNIAEGCGRNTDADFSRFLVISMGSASELEYQLILAHDLEYLSLDEYETALSELTQIKRMLNSFIQKLKGKSC